MQIVSKGDNLHEMSKPAFLKKNKKNITKLSSTELAQRMVKVNAVFLLVGIVHSFPMASISSFATLNAG